MYYFVSLWSSLGDLFLPSALPGGSFAETGLLLSISPLSFAESPLVLPLGSLKIPVFIILLSLLPLAGFAWLVFECIFLELDFWGVTSGWTSGRTAFSSFSAVKLSDSFFGKPTQYFWIKFFIYGKVLQTWIPCPWFSFVAFKIHILCPLKWQNGMDCLKKCFFSIFNCVCLRSKLLDLSFPELSQALFFKALWFIISWKASLSSRSSRLCCLILIY